MLAVLRATPGRVGASGPTHDATRLTSRPSTHLRARRSTLLHAAEPTTATTTPTTSFTTAASGEWEGAAAAFNRDGEPIALPPNYVPDAFREWGVEVADWTTQCSTIAVAPAPGAGGDDGVSLSYRLKRLLPSVGCEADATAFLDEGVAVRLGNGNGRGGGGAEEGGASLPPAFLGDGAYALAPPALPTDPASRPARFEVSLPLPPAACVAANGSVSPRRVRAVVSVAAAPASDRASPRPPILAGVELFSEKRYGDYIGGTDSLAGCGGGVGPFARTQALEAGALERGDWSVVRGVVTQSPPPAGAALTFPPADAARGSDTGRLLLPLGAWVAVRPAANGGVVVEAGVVATGSADGGVVRRSGAAEFDAGGTLLGVSLVAEVAGGGRLD